MRINSIKFVVLFLFFLFIHFLSFIPIVFAKDMNTVANQSFTSLIWLIIMVGGSITATLIYVSYKKYKNTKKQETKDNDNS